VAIAQIGHKGGTAAVAAITADVAGGRKSPVLKAIGQGPQAQHQVFHDGSVVLGKTRKHRRPSKESTNPNVFFRFA
jgi:hypothetical protein